ncbi:MAG: J domain-containing protein [Desulfobulbaceae bacterium]|nr:MAG: J domain-containing protein [Desulfobulbaceae bacterium]
MRYQRQNPPGCGGCLIIALLIIFLTGGAPALINVMGFIFFSGLAGVVIFFALFLGFSYWIRRQVSTYEASQTESHNKFVWLLVKILVHIAQMDGYVSRDEVQTIQRFFQQNLRYNQTQMAWVKNLINEATNSDESLEDLLQDFKNSFAYEPRLILLELIYQIAYTKDPVPENELEAARKIAIFLEISDYDARTIESRYQYRRTQTAADSLQSEAHYYALLGLEQGADMERIKKAYRQLSMKYHPDKVRHLGDEFRGVAEEKMKEINAAYDFFKKKNNG